MATSVAVSAPQPASVVRFVWATDLSACRARAYDAQGQLLGEVVIALPEQTRRRLWSAYAGSAPFRIEEIAERHVRAMLELRY